MISEEMFNEFYSTNISSDRMEIYHEYRVFQQHWNDFFEDYFVKGNSIYEETDYVQLAYLYSILWGDFSFAALLNGKEVKENILLGTLAATISNDILAIVKLALDGLDYQAINIVRNLYELSLLLLNIYLNEEKRNSYIESVKHGKSYEVWRKHFNVGSMLETIDNYCKNKELSEFWLKNYKSFYNRLSSFVHNDFANIYVFGYSNPQSETDLHEFNVGAHYVTRYNEILMETIDILWVITKIFRYLMEDQKLSDFSCIIFGKDNNELLRFAKNECYFANYYYLKLNNMESEL